MGSSLNHAQRRRVIRTRRILFVILMLVILALIIGLICLLVNGIRASVSGNTEPVDSFDDPLGTSVSTTVPTAAPTYPAVALNDSELSCPRLFLYDVAHNTVLFRRNEHEQCAPASMTKLMTAILTMKYTTADEVFTVGDELDLVDPESSTANLQKGYRFNREMILQAMLVPSGNDAAYTIAAHIGRKLNPDSTMTAMQAVRAFCAKMNEEAAALDALDTHFINPDGFYTVGHYSSAYDMTLIAYQALQYDLLRQIMSLSYVHTTLLSGQEVTYTSTNALIRSGSGFYLPQATGMKTGFTDEAGYCVAASAQYQGRDIIAIIMGGLTDVDRWHDATVLLNAGLAAEATH